MIDGTRTEYHVELVYTDPESGEVFPQGVVLASTEYHRAALLIAGGKTALQVAKQIKRGAEGGKRRVLTGLASSYSLMVKKVVTTQTTRRDWM